MEVGSQVAGRDPPTSPHDNEYLRYNIILKPRDRVWGSYFLINKSHFSSREECTLYQDKFQQETKAQKGIAEKTINYPLATKLATGLFLHRKPR